MDTDVLERSGQHRVRTYPRDDYRWRWHNRWEDKGTERDNPCLQFLFLSKECACGLLTVCLHGVDRAERAKGQHDSRAKLRLECNAEPRLDCSPKPQLDPAQGFGNCIPLRADAVWAVDTDVFERSGQHRVRMNPCDASWA